jgi:catechol 2,3-dioxygenase-like lactoylglutathione lyase family enzyme
MAIQLDHLIVPSHNPVDSAKSLAHLLGVPWETGRGHFTPVYVNDTLTLDFDERDGFASHHYCFHVSDEEFDGIFERVRNAGIVYRSTPTGPDDLKLNTRLGGRNFYWRDSDGHNWEVLTVSYARQEAGAAT